MTTLRMAWHLAYATTPAARWRQLMVILTTFVGVSCLLPALGVMSAAHRADQVEGARSMQWADQPGTAPLAASSRLLWVDGRQMPVLWLEPRQGHEQDPDLVPPGLTRLPGPGEVVLSPGLVARGITAESLGMRASSAGAGAGGVIGDAGLKSRSEGFAYARPEAGRTLGQGGALLALRGFGSEGAPNEGDDRDLPSLPEAAIGVALLVLAPVIYLVVSGARAVSPVRQDRAELFHRLGVPARRVRRVLVVEGLLLALPGVTSAGALWWWLLQDVTRWPWSASTLVPGAAHLPVVVVAAVGLLTALASAAASGGVRVPARTVPSRTGTLAPLPVVMVAVSALLMALARWAPWTSPIRVVLLVSGALLFLSSVPTAVPRLVGLMGPILRPGPGSAAWLARARLGTRAHALARPALMVAVLTFVAGAGLTLYQAALRLEPEQRAQLDRPVVRVADWRGERPGDAEVVRRRLSAHGLGVLAGLDDAQVVTAASCADADLFAHGVGLDAGCTGSAVSPDLARWVTDSLGKTITVGALQPKASTIHVAGPRAGDDTVLWRGMAGLPAVNVQAPDGPRGAAPPGWVLLAWLAAVTVTILGLCREMGDRALLAVLEDRPLLRLGIRAAELDRVHLISLGLPIMTAAVMGWIAACAFAVVGYGFDITTADVGAVSVVTLGTGAVAFSVLAITLLVQRRVLRIA